MNNTTYSPEDLRGMLDTYSPEQQMEINAKIISESAKTLADASAQIKECMTNFPSIITAMQKATTLHISEESKAEIIQAGKDVGIAVSKVFNESVSETIAKSSKRSKACLYSCSYGILSLLRIHCTDNLRRRHAVCKRFCMA